MLFLAAMYFSNRGLERRPFGAQHICCWLLTIISGLVFGIAGLPYATMHIMCGVFRHMGRETVGYNQNLIMDLQDFGKLRDILSDRINLIWQIYFSRSLLKI
jgi:hypothetical protein